MESTQDEPTVQHLPGLIKEWMATEDELRTLSAEVREKRKRVKLVRSIIMKIMKGNKLGRLNISTGAVTARSTSAKMSMTKKYITSALTEFFNGDAVKAAECAAFLDSNRPIKSTDSLTLEPL